MRRIVADTNVYVSALNFGGPPDEILALGRAQLIQIFVSPPLLEEIEGVLIRKFRWAPRRAREALAVIRGFATLVHPTETVAVVNEDEPDNRILECAIAAHAETVVTGDRHLLGLERFRGMAMMSPRQFLEAHPEMRGVPGG